MLKLFHVHYRIVDSAFSVAKTLDEGDATLVIDTDTEGDFDTAIADERSRIAQKHDITDEQNSPKVVFTNFSLLHTEEAIALVKPSQPKFL